MNDDITHIEKLIKKLDDYFLLGYTSIYQNLKREIFSDNFTTDQKERDEYADRATKYMTDWSELILNALKDNNFEAFYQFHFLEKTPGLSGSYSGVSIKLNNILIVLESRLHNLKEILFRLEDRKNLLIRQQIEKQQLDASVMYEITFTKQRQILVNGIQIARPDFFSENDQFFDYVFNHPYETIKVADIEASIGDKLKKPVSSILADLKFTGDLKTIFFPNTSGKAVEFRNPITKGFHSENNLPMLNLGNLRSNEKERETKRPAKK